MKIKIDVYGQTINIVKGKAIYKFFTKEELCDARGVYFTRGSNRYIWIREGDYENDAVISHECLHCVFDIMHFANVPFNYENQEVFCYLLGDINDKVKKAFKKTS